MRERIHRSRLIVLAVAALAGAAVLGATGWLTSGFSETAQAAAHQDAPFAPGSEISPDRMPLLRARLAEEAAAGRFMGVVLVARGDEVWLRQAYGMADVASGRAAQPSDRYRLASVSKQFTTAAILRLQDQGKLSVQDPVCRWVQPCPAGWEEMRLWHLMSHTSGLPDLMDRPGWGERRVISATLDELTADTMRYRPGFPPGSRAKYNNAGMNLLADIVHRVDGRSYEAFLKEEFFEPLGMADTGSDADAAGHGVVTGYNELGGGGLDPRPNANVSIIPGAGALYSTLDDMLRWNRALHRGGLLSETGYQQMIADHAPQDQGLPAGARPRKWGFGVFVSDLGTGALPEFSAEQIYHTGSWSGFRNLVSYAPEGEVTVVVLTNNYHQRDKVFLIVQQAMAEALGRPFPTGLKS